MKKDISLIEKFRQYFLYLFIVLGFLILHMIFIIIAYNISGIIFGNNSIKRQLLIGIFMIIFTILSFKIFGIEIKSLTKKFSFKINILDLMIILLIFTLLGFILTAIQQNISYNFFRDFFIDYNSKLNLNYSDKSVLNNSAYFMILLHTIVMATMEELYFRFLIQEYLLKNKYKIGTLLFISSISFGLRHFDGNIGRVIISAIDGLIISFVFIITKNLIYPIFLHFFRTVIYILISEIYFSFFDSIPKIADIKYLEFMNKYYVFCIILELVLIGLFSIISYIKRKSILSEDIIKNFKYEFKYNDNKLFD